MLEPRHYRKDNIRYAEGYVRNEQLYNIAQPIRAHVGKHAVYEGEKHHERYARYQIRIDHGQLRYIQNDALWPLFHGVYAYCGEGAYNRCNNACYKRNLKREQQGAAGLSGKNVGIILQRESVPAAKVCVRHAPAGRKIVERKHYKVNYRKVEEQQHQRKVNIPERLYFFHSRLPPSS